MPPKPKFEKEEIIAAAFEIAREQGIEEVKAREVGERLGCSSRPIFTFFSSMEELQNAVKEKAWSFFGEYLKVADDYYPSFKKRGLLLIKFAQEETFIFQLLFMTRSEALPYEEFIRKRIYGFEKDIETIIKDYNVTPEEARLIFSQLWVHAYGICVLSATGVCRFSEQEVSSILGETFAGTIMLVKKHELTSPYNMPALKGTPEGEKMKSAFLNLTGDSADVEK